MRLGYLDVTHLALKPQRLELGISARYWTPPFTFLCILPTLPFTPLHVIPRIVLASLYFLGVWFYYRNLVLWSMAKVELMVVLFCVGRRASCIKLLVFFFFQF